MPTYEFACTACHKTFTVVRPIAARGTPSCPHCGARTVQQVLSAFYAKTIKKS